MLSPVPEAPPPQGLRVLILDQSADTQAVLSAALAQRGVEALLATDAAEGLQHMSQSAPDCIVLDVDSIPEHARQASDFALATREFGQRMIVLGTLRKQRDRFAEGSFVSKPYHYAPLIRTIEALLDQRSAGEGEHRPSAAGR
jgi:CheY-like chemotaxis protein